MEIIVLISFVVNLYCKNVFGHVSREKCKLMESAITEIWDKSETKEKKRSNYFCHSMKELKISLFSITLSGMYESREDEIFYSDNNGKKTCKF